MPTKLNITLSDDDTSPINLRSPPVPPSTVGALFNPPVLVSANGTCINGIYATSDLVHPMTVTARCDLTQPVKFKVKLATDYKFEQFAPSPLGATTPAADSVCFYVQPPGGVKGPCLPVPDLGYKTSASGQIKFSVVKGSVNLTDGHGHLLDNLYYSVRFQGRDTAGEPWTNAVFDPKILNKPPGSLAVTLLEIVELHLLEITGIGLVVALFGAWIGRITKR